MKNVKLGLGIPTTPSRKPPGRPTLPPSRPPLPKSPAPSPKHLPKAGVIHIPHPISKPVESEIDPDSVSDTSNAIYEEINEEPVREVVSRTRLLLKNSF